jgi:hypothetical protein
VFVVEVIVFTAVTVPVAGAAVVPIVNPPPAVVPVTDAAMF